MAKLDSPALGRKVTVHLKHEHNFEGTLHQINESYITLVWRDKPDVAIVPWHNIQFLETEVEDDDGE